MWATMDMWVMTQVTKIMVSSMVTVANIQSKDRIITNSVVLRDNIYII